jgi:gliding motility-associated-like protein
MFSRNPINRFILLLMLLFAGVFCDAQTCTINLSDTVICQNASVLFSVNTTGGTPTAYNWAFGNGFTATTASPAHAYTSSGKFTPTVTVTFSNGTTCNATGKEITVWGAPNVNFNITTNKQMCFRGNELCILDLSTPGPSGAPIKKRVFQLSNGFLQIDTVPYPSTICYKDSTDITGHLFSLVLEVTDTNNCVSHLRKEDSVELYPKYEATFNAQIKKQCNHTLVNFANTSPIPQSKVLKFVWDFGDGGKDSTNWLATSHDYTGHGTYFPKLIVTDVNNCTHTALQSTGVNVFFNNPAIYLLKPNTQCYKGNVFAFKSVNDSASFSWEVLNDQGAGMGYISFPGDSQIAFMAPSCGAYTARVKVAAFECVFTTDSFIKVLGPGTKEKSINSHQCKIRDTVFFEDRSCRYGNNSPLKYLWDFGDAYAPQCTLDTKNGLNIGLNCNFSKDSVIQKHVYAVGKEGCYQIKYMIEDTVTGCKSDTIEQLPLMKPDASPAPNALPPREGLVASDTTLCLYDRVTFTFKDILPQCGYSKAYINLDSACGKDRWIMVDTLGIGIRDHAYDSTCSKDGYVTIGLIIVNGYEEAGNACYDTAWYHNIVLVSPINPYFKAVIKRSCEPFDVQFVPLDSIQYNLDNIYWNFNSLSSNNLNDTFTQVFSLTDSVIKSPSFQYPRAGVYGAYMAVKNRISCFVLEQKRFAVGDTANFYASKPVACLSDSIELISDIYYYDEKALFNRHPVDFWRMPARAAANQERVWWDIGDGNGFSQMGGQIKIKYPKPGKYSVTMVSVDSTGCFDTIIKPNFITVVDIKAHIATIDTQYYCAPQIVQLKDSTIIFEDSLMATRSTIDTVSKWQWNYGDHTAESLLKNGAHDFRANGSFNVRLIATSLAGCSDTAYTTINIVGPQPSFTITDTAGCTPFATTFVNTTSRQIKSWTWYYGDTSNQTFTTPYDSNTQFMYYKPGVYSIRLLGVEDVFNPTTGNTIVCSAFFPDPFSQLPVRKVHVYPIMPVGIQSLDKACVAENIVFTSTSDNSYSSFEWSMGNGDKVIMEKPQTSIDYNYIRPGKYTVTLFPTGNPVSQCWDTASSSIDILDVKADFEIEEIVSPEFRFKNTSKMADTYLWNFGKPSAGSSNQSTAENAVFNFGSDTSIYIVCLMAFNEIDCWDSICKPIHIDQQKLIIPNVFTPNNNDGLNDAFDIDILGFDEYHLLIYNRWGTKVYESSIDGKGNDGINWNGNNQVTGEPCAAGTYYYIFSYKFIKDKNAQALHGTVTLIRDK